MTTNIKNKKLSVLLFCVLPVLLFFGCQTIDEAMISQADVLGLDRSLVQSTVQNHFSTVSSQVVTGQPFNQVVQIGSHRIQYTAYRLANGTFNIGRIHAIP